jgi:predicted ArsR family transcriptional regulator
MAMDAIVRRRVTEALAAHPRGATVSEIARTANLPRHRVLTALEALQREGLAERAPVKAATGLGGPREVSGWKPAGGAPKRPRPALRGGLDCPGAG